MKPWAGEREDPVTGERNHASVDPPARARARLVDAATRADGPRATLLVRAVVGAVFLSEGTQKFLFPGELGEGRFARIGIPWPEVLGPFVGLVEVAGGTLLLAGVFTRVVAVPLLVTMLVAITSTKIATLGEKGFWKTAHEARTDLLMIFCLLFLLVSGAGPLSVDGALRRRRPASRGS
jgi:putative oxidoreductase